MHEIRKWKYTRNKYLYNLHILIISINSSFIFVISLFPVENLLNFPIEFHIPQVPSLGGPFSQVDPSIGEKA